MKITIEFKNKQYTVKCDTLTATAPTLREAVIKIADDFKARLMQIVDQK